MKQPNQYKTHEGYDLEAVNINWTKEPSKAWQCNFGSMIFYASTAEEVFEKVIRYIDNLN